LLKRVLRLRKKETILLSPLILAAFPLVYLAAETTGEGISLVQVLLPLMIVLAGTATVTLLLRSVVKNSAKVAAIISLLVLAFFAYGHVYDVLYGWMVDNDIRMAGVLIARHRYLLPSSVLLTLIGVILLLRYREDLTSPLLMVTVGVALLVTFNLGRIGLHVDLNWGDESSDQQPAIAVVGPGLGFGELPDIYYFILDGYGGSAVLETTHGFDNRVFIDDLTEKGFYVPPRGRSNYVLTFLSLASSLNMRYLDDRDDVRAVGGIGRRLKESARIDDNTVLRLAQSLGYKWVQVDSGVGGTERNRFADEQFLFDRPYENILNLYSREVLRSTMAQPVADMLGLSLDASLNRKSAELFDFAIASLRLIPGMEDPTFTFMHSMVTHPPYVFGRDGNIRLEAEHDMTVGWERTDLYVDQLGYVNDTMLQLIDHILERSTVEPIIIIQGDHGPASNDRTGLMENAGDLLKFERSGILNAYYLPERCRSALYPTITPVNSFRLVFKECFGADLDLLEDVTYWSSYTRAHDFVRYEP
jgi:hypothetical protein